MTQCYMHYVCSCQYSYSILASLGVACAHIFLSSPVTGVKGMQAAVAIISKQGHVMSEVSL